jgi:hypothetical protein
MKHLAQVYKVVGSEDPIELINGKTMLDLPLVGITRGMN